MSEALATPRKEDVPGVVRQVSLRTLELWVRESLGFVLDIVEVKRSLKVRPKDLEVYYGIHDKGPLTRFGKVLVLIEWVGLAKCSNRLSRSRPKRYTLQPKDLWKRYVEVCGRARFNCKEDGSPCSLIGICPYWRVIEYARWYYGNGGRRQ